MLYEYAVEPSAIGQDWGTFRYLIEKFGFDKGRLIAWFPSSWERDVWIAARASGMGQIKLKSVEQRLAQARKNGLYRRGRRYDPGLGNWSSNALQQHMVLPFRAILMSDPDVGNASTLRANEVDEATSLFVVQTSWEAVRTPFEIAKAVGPLISAAKEIMIVDPYLDLRNPKLEDYSGPLREMLTYMSLCGVKNRSIQLHFSTHDSRPNQQFIIDNARKWVRGMIPESFSLELFEWRQRPGGAHFHDRYVLCDCGGISAGAGFGAVGSHQNVSFTLLSLEDVAAKSARLRLDTCAYDLVQPVIKIDHHGNASVLE